MELIKAQSFNDGKSFKEAFIKVFLDSPYSFFKLCFSNETFSNIDQVHIGYDSCSLLTNGGFVGIQVPRTAAMQCVLGKKQLKRISNKYSEVLNTLSKIREVLGDVPATDELEKSTNSLIEEVKILLGSTDEKPKSK